MERKSSPIGYTHYFEKKIAVGVADWEKFVPKVQRIIDFERSKGVLLEVEACDELSVSLNGIEEDSHETFFLNRQPSDFSFCKTAQKPYDLTVTTILALAEETLPGFSWSSDGGHEAKEQAKENLATIFPLEGKVNDKIDNLVGALEDLKKPRKVSPPRKLTLTLPQIKKVLSKHLSEDGTWLPSILDELCQAAKVETPRDILRQVKRNQREIENQKVRDFVSQKLLESRDVDQQKITSNILDTLGLR